MATSILDFCVVPVLYQISRIFSIYFRKNMDITYAYCNQQKNTENPLSRKLAGTKNPANRNQQECSEKSRTMMCPIVLSCANRKENLANFTPTFQASDNKKEVGKPYKKIFGFFYLASLRGFEPPAYRLGGGRSILLSYSDIYRHRIHNSTEHCFTLYLYSTSVVIISHS